MKCRSATKQFNYTAVCIQENIFPSTEENEEKDTELSSSTEKTTEQVIMKKSSCTCNLGWESNCYQRDEKQQCSCVNSLQ